MDLNNVSSAELTNFVGVAESLTPKAYSSSTMMDWFAVCTDGGEPLGKIGRMDGAWFSAPGQGLKTRYGINTSIDALIYLLTPEAEENEESSEVFEMSI